MNCRHCRAPVTVPFMDLGTAPPSNAYLKEDDLSRPEVWYPLRVLVCTNCWLVQTQDYASASEIFKDDYAYFSSYSRQWLEHSEGYVDKMVGRLGLTDASLIVELAANDGYLLQYVKARGIPCLGVEPTASTAASARSKGIEIIQEFFDTQLARSMVANGRSADLVTANNVLAHVPDINEFVRGVSLLLKPSGVATFEFPHLLNLIAYRQFDTVYHEHYSYLSLTAVQRIFTANGLIVFDVEEIPTHGGSLRVYAQIANGPHEISRSVNDLLRREEATGLKTREHYAGFQDLANQVKNGLIRFLLDAKSSGRKVAAYGAAAKGNTLLNYAGLRADMLEYVVDKNPAKQGKYLPGSRIPIVEEHRLRAEQPDYILILPWNIRTELVRDLSYARAWGAQFVTAVPTIRIEA